MKYKPEVYKGYHINFSRGYTQSLVMATALELGLTSQYIGVGYTKAIAFEEAKKNIDNIKRSKHDKV